MPGGMPGDAGDNWGKRNARPKTLSRAFSIANLINNFNIC